MRAAAALAGVLAAAACSVRPGPTVADELALVARDLREGRLEAASERIAGLRRRDPRDVDVASWQATIASLTWRDEEAVLAQQAAIRGARAQGRSRAEIAELEGRLGDLLFLAGRWGESVAALTGSVAVAGDERRRAFAAIATALPFVRRASGPLLSEQRLLAGELPEFLCGVGDRQRPFVVDTGTSMTTVSSSFAEQLAVHRRTPAGRVLDAAGRELATDVGVLERFCIGDIDVGSVPVLVVADEAMQLRDLHGGLERVPRGILGLDLLASCRLTLDPERSSVVIELPRGLPEEQSVSCVRVDGRCLLPVFVEDVRMWFVLDTGASHSSLTAAGLARLAGGEGRATPAHRRVRTVGGSLVAVREVRSVDLRCSEAPFGRVDLPVVPRGDSVLFPVHGVLGIDQLRTCRLILDRGRARLVALP